MRELSAISQKLAMLRVLAEFPCKSEEPVFDN
jgi:hypothetical protein